MQDVYDAGLRDDAAEDRLEVVSAELAQLNDPTLRDAQTREFGDVVNTFLGTCVSLPDRSTQLALPEVVLAPDPIAPGGEYAAHVIESAARDVDSSAARDADSSKARDIACHLCRCLADEEGEACGTGAVPAVCASGRSGGPTSYGIWQPGLVMILQKV